MVAMHTLHVTKGIRVRDEMSSGSSEKEREMKETQKKNDCIKRKGEKERD